MQVIRTFSLTNTFSAHVKNVVDGTLVHKATRMRLFTGERLHVETPSIFLTVTIECMISTRLDPPDC